MSAAGAPPAEAEVSPARPAHQVLGAAGLGSACLAPVAAAPAALRIANDGLSVPVALLAAAGSVALLLGPVILAGRAIEGRGARFGTLGVGIALALGPLAAFGGVLKAATHHRQLGAVTFAIVAAVVVCGAVAVAHRLLELSRGDGLSRVVARAGIGVSVVVSTALFVRGLVAALGADGAQSGLRPTVLDLALLVAAAVVGTRASFPRRVPAAAGLVAWPLLVVAALASFRSSPELGSKASRVAPLVVAPVSWIAPR